MFSGLLTVIDKKYDPQPTMEYIPEECYTAECGIVFSTHNIYLSSVDYPL